MSTNLSSIDEWIHFLLSFPSLPSPSGRIPAVADHSVCSSVSQTCSVEQIPPVKMPSSPPLPPGSCKRWNVWRKMGEVLMF